MAKPGIRAEVRGRVARLPRDVGPLGTDGFGYDPEAVERAAIPAAWLYRHWFRVCCEGIEKVPDGRVLLVANHSGQLPFDGMMICSAMMLERNPPRVARAMVERWVPRLPFVSVMMARSGQVVGTPENCRRLLRMEQAILVFPEGVRGLSKTFDKRYQLQHFGSGFMRLALECQAPIVPVSVVGAEEQAPALANLSKLGRAFGMPALPVTPTFPLLGPAGLLPLPVRYHMRFGDPLRFEGDGQEDEHVVQEKVALVVAALRQQIDELLARRTGIFR
ncbi:MAG: lysophospholipid acyltransferase family protein [Myxococcota bacterium]